MELPILEEFDKALDQINDRTKAIKGSLQPYAWLFITKLAANLPSVIRDLLISFVSKYQVVGFSFQQMNRVNLKMNKRMLQKAIHMSNTYPITRCGC